MAAETLNFVELGLVSVTTLDTCSNPADVEVNCNDCGRMSKASRWMQLEGSGGWTKDQGFKGDAIEG